jgi:predicted P-loop ATPase/GTPase
MFHGRTTIASQSLERTYTLHWRLSPALYDEETFFKTSCLECYFNGKSFHSYTIVSAVNLEGESMGNLTGALQQLRAERKQAQSHVEKLDQAISVIESLNGYGTFGTTNQSGRIISAASRRKMARAQRARWARAKNGSRPVVAIAKTAASAPVKHTMSAAARRKIGAFQRARWAKLKAQQKKAA